MRIDGVGCAKTVEAVSADLLAEHAVIVIEIESKMNADFRFTNRWYHAASRV